MTSLLSGNKYIFDPQTNIWSSNNYSGIEYSDGDAFEDNILSILQRTKDLSVLSNDLKEFCIDWPSTYHLSGTRANILRPFEDLLRGDVLEIGAGCGAITRYIGECGGNVIALEGSRRRAQIARTRTKELANVHVLAESFEDLEISYRFDVITLIGVLEYSNLFIEDEQPALKFLSKVRSLLKPSGKLIIAIENQLGLKYFSGAPEDHLNIPMYGIEGRYQKNQPETFGKKAISALLKKSNLDKIDFLFPFPDYKFPASIITEQGMFDDDFDSATITWLSARNDPQLPEFEVFSLDRTWPHIFRNGISQDLSNSFLICASSKELNPEPISTSILAYHYSYDRRPQFCKEIIFDRKISSNISISYRNNFHHSKTDTNKDPIKFIPSTSAPYHKGALFSTELMHVLYKDGWTIEETKIFIRKYLDIIFSFSESLNHKIDGPKIETILPGVLFDLIPQNIIVKGKKQYEAIDFEWELLRPLELGHLIFRAILSVVNKISRFGYTEGIQDYTKEKLILKIMEASGFKLNDTDLERYASEEALVQEFVTGKKIDRNTVWNLSSKLSYQNIYDAKRNLDDTNHVLLSKVTAHEKEIGVYDTLLIEERKKTAMYDELLLKERSLNKEIDLLLVKEKGKTALLDQTLIEDRKKMYELDSLLIEERGKCRNLDLLLIKEKQKSEELDLLLSESRNYARELDIAIKEEQKKYIVKEDELKKLSQLYDERNSQVQLIIDELKRNKITVDFTKTQIIFDSKNILEHTTHFIKGAWRNK